MKPGTAAVGFALTLCLLGANGASARIPAGERTTAAEIACGDIQDDFDIGSRELALAHLRNARASSIEEKEQELRTTTGHWMTLCQETFGVIDARVENPEDLQKLFETLANQWRN